MEESSLQAGVLSTLPLQHYFYKLLYLAESLTLMVGCAGLECMDAFGETFCNVVGWPCLCVRVHVCVHVCLSVCEFLC